MRIAIAVFSVSAALAALLFARPHSTPGPPMRDFEAYYAAGSIWNAGGDPYSSQIWDAERSLSGVSSNRYEVLPFVGPPATLPIAGAIARLPFGTANAVWRSLLIAACAVLVLVALSLAGARIEPLFFVLVSSAALGFGPLTSAVALGQIALPAFVFAAIGVKRPAATVFAWLQPNIALCASALPYFSATLSIFAAACVALSGWHGAMHYVSVLRAHAAAEQFSLIQLAPASIVYGFGAPAALALIAGVAASIAALVIWIARAVPMKDATARFCATCALLPFAVPFFHEHDLVIEFVPAIVLSRWGGDRAFPWIAAGALLCAADWLGIAQRPDGTVQTLLLVAAFGAALVALRPAPRPGGLYVTAAVLASIALAGLAAVSHPAPVWPDAMRALPKNADGMDVSSAWHAELAATGLFARNAFWAALRCMSLLGCGLLAYGCLNVDVHHVVELRNRVGVEVL